jgi:trehalose 6-phosphate phosphatase
VRPILAPEARPVLEAAARERALLVFDFDGTLAPIVPDRAAARVPESTRALLRAVAVLYPTAVLSGRARADVAGRLDGIPLVAVVGNHGAEAGHGPLDRSRRALVVSWREALAAGLAAHPGIELEDKHFSLAVHYRRAPCRTAARRAVLACAGRLARAHVFVGRAVVNLVPDDAPDKGVAIDELQRRTAARQVVYVGDDRTDEDVFRSGRVEVGIRVGRTRRSSAQYYLPAQRDVDGLLRALLGARLRLDGRGEACDGLVRAVKP